MVGASRQPTRSAEIPRAQLVLDQIDPAHGPIHSETRTNFAHTFYTLGLELWRNDLSRSRQSIHLQCRNRFLSTARRKPGHPPPRSSTSAGAGLGRSWPSFKVRNTALRSELPRAAYRWRAGNNGLSNGPTALHPLGGSWLGVEKPGRAVDATLGATSDSNSKTTSGTLLPLVLNLSRGGCPFWRSS